MALPSCLLCSERNKRPVFWVSASRQIETTHIQARSFITSHACHTFTLSNAFQQQSLPLLREQTFVSENPAGYLVIACRVRFRLQHLFSTIQ